MTADRITADEFVTHTLNRVRATLRSRAITGVVLEHADIRHLNHVADIIAVDIEAAMWEERLPPQRVADYITTEHPEAVGKTGVAHDIRFATWWDHFAETYRRRWWARLIGLRHRRTRYITVKVPYVITAPVSCRHYVTVDIADAWRFPNPPGIPGNVAGEAVLHSYANPMRHSALRVDHLAEGVDYRW